MHDLAIRRVPHGSAEYSETIYLRHNVLRLPLGLAFIAEDLDNEIDYIHIACYAGDRLVGCLVLVPLENGDVKMRQVAVAPDSQRSGAGSAMVAFAENEASGFQKMVLNARNTAVAFYERLGYVTVGEEFIEVGIPHHRMEKRLH